MIQMTEYGECKKSLICVDSYDDGVLNGHFYHPRCDGEAFKSLSQFLIRMDELLNETGALWFRNLAPLVPEQWEVSGPSLKRGKLATFEVRVLFRRHSSWQGVLHWQEAGQEQNFRSVLELVHLLDNVLRKQEKLENKVG